MDTFLTVYEHAHTKFLSPYTLSIRAPAGQNLVLGLFGNTACSLVNGYSQAGNYNIQWNAIDEYGQRMGAGLYFYSITTENISETKKMILLK